MSETVLIRAARVLTMGGAAGVRCGAAMGDLGVLDRADVLIRDGRIREITKSSIDAPSDARVIEAAGRVLMPGFVDAHTHALWAGDRLDEWERKRAGATYLEILESGGGIMSTVGAVRQASEAQLVNNLRGRLDLMLREGTTSVEVKSGYGLSTNDELKMLRAIRTASKSWPGTTISTALLGHAVDPMQRDFFERTVSETLPAVHEEFPGVAIDAYCEQGAWPLAQCVSLFEMAQELDHPFRVHTDQFNELGMTQWAIEHGTLSVDHLEASSAETLDRIAASETVAVLLPCSGFHVDGRYAEGRRLIDAGAKVVIATNCNPGSAPTSSMPMAIALAVRECGLTPSEAISACTINAASLLGFEDRGYIARGARADLVLLRHRDERALAHEFGGDPVDFVVCGGVVLES